MTSLLEEERPTAIVILGRAARNQRNSRQLWEDQTCKAWGWSGTRAWNSWEEGTTGISMQFPVFTQTSTECSRGWQEAQQEAERDSAWGKSADVWGWGRRRESFQGLQAWMGRRQQLPSIWEEVGRNSESPTGSRIQLIFDVGETTERNP